jgi:transposase
MIAAGKTPAIEVSHFGDVAYHRTGHCESGSQTTETFIEWLRSRYDDRGPIWLIIDCYSVHRQETIRAYAEDLGIHLLFFPPGLTNELRPLDRFVFCAMNGTCRRLY